MELCPLFPNTLSNSKKKQCYLSPSYVSVISNNMLHPNLFDPKSCFCSPLRPDSAYLGNRMLENFLYVATIIFIFSAIIDVTNPAVRLFTLTLFTAFLTYSTANESNLFDNEGEFRLG